MSTLVSRILTARPAPTALWWAAGLVAAAIAGFGLLGALFIGDVTFAGHGLYRFDLDAENTLPSAFSALLLLATALAAFADGRDPGRLPARAAIGLGAVFTLMAADEFLAVHEHIEKALGVDWQTVYLPIAAGAGVLWVRLARSFGERRVVSMWVLGAAAWGIAQVIEKVQWDGDVLVHVWTIVPEETLEMAGSALFLFALVWERALRPSPAAQATMVAQPTTAPSRPMNTAV